MNLKKSFIQSEVKERVIKALVSLLVAIAIYLLLVFALLYFVKDFETKTVPKKKVMQIDLQTLPTPKKEEVPLKKEQKQPPKKPLKAFESYDKELNKEKGKAQKEIKDKQKAPQTPLKKETKVVKEVIQKQSEQKPKETPKLEEKKESVFPSFEKIGKALEQKKQKDAQKKIDTKKQRELKQLYGKKYDSLGRAQKKFLTTNIKTIQSITQRELNYMGYPQIAIRTRQNGANLVEFYLYPNGDITDLQLIESADSNALDSHTIELIKRAYKDYPYPDKKTLVRIKVFYNAF